jgi:hypothetical protein
MPKAMWLWFSIVQECIEDLETVMEKAKLLFMEIDLKRKNSRIKIKPTK